MQTHKNACVAAVQVQCRQTFSVDKRLINRRLDTFCSCFFLLIIKYNSINLDTVHSFNNRSQFPFRHYLHQKLCPWRFCLQTEQLLHQTVRFGMKNHCINVNDTLLFLIAIWFIYRLKSLQYAFFLHPPSSYLTTSTFRDKCNRILFFHSKTCAATSPILEITKSPTLVRQLQIEQLQSKFSSHIPETRPRPNTPWQYHIQTFNAFPSASTRYFRNMLSVWRDNNIHSTPASPKISRS